MAHAIIVVDRAIFAAEAKCALTRVVVTLVNAGRTVFTRVKILGAELDLFIAKNA